MRPSLHTRLINYIIGLCRKEQNWPSTLADLGYDVQLIEQKIGPVKPDVVAASKRLAHCLVTECKGGKTISTDQLTRYSELTNEDLFRWVDIQRDFRFDVCISDTEDDHTAIVDQSEPFPILTFGEKEIHKTRNFKLDDLNDAFSQPIPLEHAVPPLSYYPFSDDDDDLFIMRHVLRTLVSIAIKRARGGPSALAEGVIDSGEILSKIHKLWGLISMEHQNRLKERIKRVLKRAMDAGLGEYLQEVEDRHGYRVQGPLMNFTNKCEELLSQPSIEMY